MIMIPIQCKIKMIHDPSEHDAHLAVCKILANAVAGSVAERLEDGPIVPFEAAIITWV